MNKAHSPINWENYPKETTPINEENLNKMDRAIGIIDDRVVELDNTKASKDEISSVISDVEYDEQNFFLEFTRKNGDGKKIPIKNITVDSELSETSTNPVQNKVVTKEIRQLSEDNAELRQAVLSETERAIARENEIEELFTAPTQEAVNAWLDEHPEATTTVQDKSIDISKLSDRLIKSLSGKRNFAPKLTVSPWFYNRNYEQMKSYVDNYIKTGYEGMIVCVHIINTDDGLSTNENINNLINVIAYGNALNFPTTMIKIHYTDLPLDTEDEKNKYENKVLEIANAFTDSGVKRFCILNELESFFTTDNEEYILRLVRNIKSIGYEVSISHNSPNMLAQKYIDIPNVYEELDYLAFNHYPSCGANKELTTNDDVRRAFDSYRCYIKYVLSKVNKPIVITETGIRPYPIYFSAPATYEYDGTYEDYSVQITYLKGLFKSFIKVIADEVSVWFAIEDPDGTKGLAQLINGEIAKIWKGDV